MKTLLLILAAIVAWALGVGVCFVAGGIVTKVFHASDAGLALFILASIAWTVWLAVKVAGGFIRALRS